MYKLIFTESFTKRTAKFIRKHPELTDPYRSTLELLQLNPFHPSLRLHKLQGKLKELYAVSINISYRITLQFLLSENEILLINIGSHELVY